jgi:hypothetical protein
MDLQCAVRSFLHLHLTPPLTVSLVSTPAPVLRSNRLHQRTVYHPLQVWQLRGRYPNRGYPKIFNDATVGSEARKLFEEAQTMLADFVANKRVRLNGIVGFYPANAVGDDIEVGAAHGKRSAALCDVCSLCVERGTSHSVRGASRWCGATVCCECTCMSSCCIGCVR